MPIHARLDGTAKPCNRSDMETQPVTFRLPEDLYEWLRREAFDTREPMNTIVVTALQELRTRREGHP
jgi:hypothetical protein